MTVQLINGRFSASEAIDIITQMIHVKIKFHENKINADSTEEDTKSRESKIKQLQKELYEARAGIARSGGEVVIDCKIQL